MVPGLADEGVQSTHHCMLCYCSYEVPGFQGISLMVNKSIAALEEFHCLEICLSSLNQHGFMALTAEACNAHLVACMHVVHKL